MNKGKKEFKSNLKHLCERDSFTIKNYIKILKTVLSPGILYWNTKVYKPVINNYPTFGATLSAVSTLIYDLALNINMLCNICNNGSLRCLKFFYQNPVRLKR